MTPDGVLRIRICTLESELLSEMFCRLGLLRAFSKNRCVRDSNSISNRRRGARRLHFDCQAISTTTIGADQVEPIIKSGVSRDDEECVGSDDCHSLLNRVNHLVALEHLTSQVRAGLDPGSQCSQLSCVHQEHRRHVASRWFPANIPSPDSAWISGSAS